MTSNEALWLRSKRGALEVGLAPDPEPAPNEIVIRSRAVAMNVFDHLIHTVGHLVTPYLEYPAILGTDVAGEVIKVGSAVTRFKDGDRVVGFAAGTDKTRNRAVEGAFQRRVILLEHMASHIPDDITFEEAAVIPLGISTAACGLFQEDYLALDEPSAGKTPGNQSLLIWGGSTSVGMNAIQLAVAAGYDVVTTASPRNFERLRALGARHVVDYHDTEAATKIVRAFNGRNLAGALAIGRGSAKKCIDVVAACEGTCFVAQATAPETFEHIPLGPGHWRALIPAMMRTVLKNASIFLYAKRQGVRTKFIWGSALVSNEIGPRIFQYFLPQALAERRFRPLPEPLVVGSGLEAIPSALDKRVAGVSASKVVVSLP